MAIDWTGGARTAVLLKRVGLAREFDRNRSAARPGRWSESARHGELGYGRVPVFATYVHVGGLVFGVVELIRD